MTNTANDLNMRIDHWINIMMIIIMIMMIIMIIMQFLDTFLVILADR